MHIYLELAESNIVDPDQSALSNLGLYCLVVKNIKISSDSARPKCSPDILSGQHSPCSDILKYFRTNDESIILF